MLPVSRCSLRKRPTELMLTSHCSAASGIVAPPSIAATTRVRKSSESGFAIHAGLLPAGSLNHIRHPIGIPRFSLFGKRSNTTPRHEVLGFLPHAHAHAPPPPLLSAEAGGGKGDAGGGGGGEAACSVLGASPSPALPRRRGRGRWSRKRLA